MSDSTEPEHLLAQAFWGNSMDATVIILAAGEGTRMKSNHAKVSHRILAKPMIRWIVDASLAAGAQRVVTVVGSHGD